MELIRSLYAAAGTDIAGLFRDPSFEQLKDAFAPAFAPSFASAIVMPGEEPGEVATRSGLDGLREVWLDWLEPWESYRTGEQEFVDLGDRVLVLGRDRARNRISEHEIEVPIAALWTVEHGAVTRAEFYNLQEQALEVAGVERAADGSLRVARSGR